MFSRDAAHVSMEDKMSLLKSKPVFGVSDKVGHKMSLVVRKPVFGVSDQVRHKPGCTATEDG